MPIETIHSGAGAVVKGGKTVDRYLKRTRQHADKSLTTAVKVEGFRLMRLLKKEIRQGAPGGKYLKPISFISRRLERVVKTGGGTTRRQSPNRKPMVRMAVGVRYDATTKGQIRVGFVSSRGKAMDWQDGTWRFLAQKHDRRFSTQISPELRQRILSRGGSLGSVEGGETPFFLKKRTRSFTTPARPIVEPFWDAHKHAVPINIKRNFKLKLKGKRI